MVLDISGYTLTGINLPAEQWGVKEILPTALVQVFSHLGDVPSRTITHREQYMFVILLCSQSLWL